MINIKKITFTESNHKTKSLSFESNDNNSKKNNKSILEKKLISPVFYVSKFHKRKCSHSSSKTQKNLIKKLVKEDYLIFKKSYSKILKIEFDNNSISEKIRKTKNKGKKDKKIDNLIHICPYNISDFSNSNNSINICMKENNLFLKKKTTNRNFRLFDKDVVIKKIMTNFLKFLKLILENLLVATNLSSFYELKKKNFEENFANELKCQMYLKNKRIRDFVTIKRFNSFKKSQNNNNKKLENEYELLFNSKIIEIYQDVFLNSNFLQKYTFPKIKKDHDLSYYIHFKKFLIKIIE